MYIDERKVFLLNELTSRKNRNPSYSLRAFARDLGLGVTSLSDFFKGKRDLSKSNWIKVTQKLHLSPQEAEKLLLREDASKGQKLPDREVLKEDVFRLIADWYYLAILNLARLKNSKGDPLWLASRLGLEVEVVKEALERLLRLKLVKIQNGKLIRTAKPLTTTKDVPSEAIQRHHRQNLILAERALNEVPVNLREFGSVTMTVDLQNLQKAKDLLLKTREKIINILSSNSASEVYTLSFQLFPISKKGVLK